ncbi:hypothetical protein Ahy_A07g034461 isoform C [Arachis hypogaea]|uniref:Uncharacterized protein n=1 Tax=Arachis hypogaea TaxID=3818 RepID=A0A445CBV5_ARAHY|nr:hypothetical protein Ahy_A07g034461 isoform C [Arachis hypogaea]
MENKKALVSFPKIVAGIYLSTAEPEKLSRKMQKSSYQHGSLVVLHVASSSSSQIPSLNSRNGTTLFSLLYPSLFLHQRRTFSPTHQSTDIV